MMTILISFEGRKMADSAKVLKQADHMRDMEATTFTVVSVERPSPSLVRVSGEVNAQNLSVWSAPNLAIRFALPNPDGGKPFSRIYTIRSFDPATAVAVVDFVWHDHPSPAMNWVRAAKPGDVVSLTGPRPHFLPNFDAGKTCLIFADETALPAVYSILQFWREGAKGHIYIETDDKAAFDELPDVEGVERHLLLRGEGQRNLLIDAALAHPHAQSCTIWAAGERDDARALRKHFHETCGLGRDDIRIYGYWKRGATNSDIDEKRLSAYEALVAKGGTLEDLDDLDIAI